MSLKLRKCIRSASANIFMAAGVPSQSRVGY